MLLLSAALLGAADSDRAKLAGAWNAGEGDARAAWILAENGDSMHVTYMQNDRKVLDFECNTVGRECEVKDAGKPVKVSMWFNGPKLVVMETRGSDVMKRRFHAAGEDEMELELMPLVPSGKPELLRLKRAPASH
jgi:hypothetical protein